MCLPSLRQVMCCGAILALVVKFACPLLAGDVLPPAAAPAETRALLDWVDRAFAKPGKDPRSNVPLSFVYGNVHSAEFLPQWEYSSQRSELPSGWRNTIIYKDPKTGLAVQCDLTVHTDAAAVNWVITLENQGKADTPILENLLPLDCGNLLQVEPVGGEVLLRSSKGDNCWPDSFLPHDEPLVPEKERSFTSWGSDTGCLPFFNVKSPQDGWLLAVGWTGGWRASFRRSSQGQVGVYAGMQTTHFSLKPGERVRTPRIVLLRYQGSDMIRGHNQFRRMLLMHYVPRRDGKPIQPPVALNTCGGLWLKAARKKEPVGRLSEATERKSIERLAQLGGEAYWMDAYWMPQPWGGDNTGNWYPRPDDFPNGLRPLADAAHERGLKFVLWFATIIANPGSMMAKEHPQCIHGNTWTLGDPKAREALIQWVLNRQREWKFDVYREDFGVGQPPSDGPNRVGIGEMLHIDGFYRFWSELLKRHPSLVIDNCAGGGRRIDFETACLAYVLWRSDFNDIGEGLKDKAYWPMMARSDQVMVSGLSLYFPLNAGPIWDVRPYCFRSAMTQGIVLYTDLNAPEFSDDQARAAIAELKELRPLFLGDLYPLLPLTMSQADWYAYQLDRPDMKRGCALLFRRPENKETVREIKLQNIDPEAEYSVVIAGETYAKAPARQMRGQELLPLKVQINEKPGSVLVQYARVTTQSGPR